MKKDTNIGNRFRVRLKRAGTKIHLSTQTAAIRACENAWHNILDFGQPAAIESQVAPEVSVNSEEV